MKRSRKTRTLQPTGYQPGKLPDQSEIELPPRHYQPSKAEIEEEHDMPKAKITTLRRAFFRPFSIREGR